MPFVSQKQARYLFAKEPKVAEEFADATPDMDDLPVQSGTARRFSNMLNEKSVKPYHRRRERKKKQPRKSPWAKLKEKEY
jgi:hypothetical protein